MIGRALATRSFFRAAPAVAVVVAAFVACGGATAGAIGGGDGGSSGSSGSSGSGGGDGSGGDGATKPRLEDLETCDKPGACVLDAPGCCGLNCQPDSQLIGVRRGTTGDVVKATCDQNGPVACPGCARQIEGFTQAFCRAGKCAVVDVRTDAVSACAKNEDCILRYAECCQPCNGGPVNDVVSINASSEGELTLQLCAGNETCDKCLPAFPGTMHAICNLTSGHCEVAGN